MAAARILYDADCGFCKACVGALLTWDRRQQLRPVKLQSAEAEQILPGLDAETRMASWHLVVGPGDSVYSAGEAFKPLFSLLPGGRPLARVVDALPQSAVDEAYRWVADHRAWFGRPLPDAAKRRAAERIEARAQGLSAGS